MSAPDLVTLLRDRACRQPEAIAYIFDDGAGDERPVTYAWLDLRARAVAAAIAARGVGPGERALLMFAPGPDYVTGFFGCLYAGVIAVPVYPPEDARGLERVGGVWADCSPVLILSTSDIEAVAGIDLPWLSTDAVDDVTGGQWVPPDTSPQTIAFLQYTSGSTANPKGVMVTHANLIHNSSVICGALDLGPHSIGMSWLPPYHDMGLIGGILQPLYGGFPCVLMSPRAFLRDPVRWLSAISRHRATISAAPDFAYAECLRRIAPTQRAGLDLSTWEHALVGAEPVRPDTLRTFTSAFGECGFRPTAWYPCYGLAEATLFVTGGEPGAPPATLDTLTGCGFARSPDAVTIVKAAGEGTGEEDGEIWVSGPTVAAGYWGGDDPSSPVFGCVLEGDDRRWLRTGDLGFVRDGQLYITGRVKDVIVVRGRNHHPQDIELTAERAHPRLRPHRGAAFAAAESVVLVHEVTRDFRDEEADAVVAAIRAAVLAAHGISLRDVVLVRGGTVPRTSSGKVRRAACRSLYLEGALGPAVAEPAVPVAPLAAPPLIDLVARVLGVDAAQVSASDTLVGLGLDSVSAIALQAALQDELGITVGLDHMLGCTVADLFMRGPQVCAPAASARPHSKAEPTGNAASASGAETPEAGIPEDGEPVASFGQERLWLLHRADPKSSAYNIGAVLKLYGRLDRARLLECLREVQRRHGSLRTTFILDDEGTLRQRVAPEPALSLRADVAGPFDLEAAPPVRVALLRVSDVEHHLLVAAHHIVADAASLEIILGDLAALYRGGQLAPAPQYAGWASAERARLTPSGLAGDLAYWRDRLRGVEPLRLLGPTPPAVDTGSAHRVALELPTARLREFARAHSCTPFMVVVAAFSAVLVRWSGQPEAVVATPLSGRDRPDSAGVVGFVTNTVALRVAAHPGLTVRELVANARAVCLEAYARGGVPFEKVIEAVRPARSTGLAPLAQAMLALRRRPGGVALDDDLTCEAYEIASDDTQFDVAVHLTEEGDCLTGFAWARAGLLSADDLDRLAQGLAVLLEAMLDDPGHRIGRLPIQRAAQMPQGPVTGSSGLCLHELFERQADRAPANIAVIYDGKAVTYGQLESRANRLANRLLAAGVGVEDLVGICVPRSPEMVVALLAVLKAGAAYVPLDPDYPPARLAFMVKDVGARIVLATGQTISSGLLDDGPLNGGVAQLIDVEESPRQWSPERPNVAVRPDNLAYVIYTSGSTGLPKGVMNAHRGVVNRIEWGQRHFGLDVDEAVLQKTPLGFDVSGWELYWPLSVGAKLVVARPGGHRDPEYLSAVIRAERVTTVQFVPSMLDVFLTQPTAPDCAAVLRQVVCSGEALSPALVNAFHERLPGVRLFNLYGPTEAAIEVTASECAPGTTRVTIGHAIDNARIHVLEPSGMPTPIGVAGELHIGGLPVARGYWRRPGLTAQRFVPDPFGHGTRLYRSGDLARVCPDGAIDYLGRLDHQVKIRGVRVELGEVEAALCRYPGVRAAAVDARQASAGGQRLIGYLVCEGPPPSAAQLREHLAEQLPQAMIPSAYLVVPSLPMTPSGKLDRAALPDPRGRASAADYAPPANRIEEILSEIWAQVLGADRVGVNDDFFELGGHSLLATKVLARVRAAFGVEPPLAELLAGRLTVRGMAELVAVGQLTATDADEILALIAEIDAQPAVEADRG